MEGSRFGPYQLLHPLGAGGMGQVFLARQQGEHGIQRLVAVKCMLAQHARRKKLVNLFLDEVRIAAQLNHGNIIQVIDHGVTDRQYYMAMEYVHGENLLEVINRLLDRKQLMPIDLVLQVGSHICEGLSYAHTKKAMDGRALGIVHRDISPQNVMISFQGEVKIADFGVARAAEQTHQTIGGELKGKLAYMSPEQAFGKPLDHRSDLFSLGVVLYEACSGSSPFMRDNPMATLEAVRAAQVVSLATLRPELPEEVSELVHHALSPEPADRPDSARAMYEELQRIMRLNNMVVSAFDLADFMSDLFPESRPADEGGQDGGPGGTAVGRRADGEDLERRTLFYLRQRHPETHVDELQRQTAATGAVQRGGDKAEDEGTGDAVPRSSEWRWLVGLSLVGLIAGLAVALYYRFGASDPPQPVADSAVSARTQDAAVSTPPDGEAAQLDQSTPQTTATLVVRSTPPGAWVKVSGKRLPEVTPLTAALSPGRYLCTLGLAGHRPLERRVRLRPGQSARLDARLEALPGRLSVSSTHPCRVQLNGKPAGETPLRGHRIAAGRVKVLCLDAAAHVRVTRTVKVPPGGAASTMFRFGVLAVNVQPWAHVTVDGRRRGTTPLRLVLPVGEHRVTLANSERKLERRLRIEIALNRTTRVSSW
jgi:serine/threonine-protein kinase